MPLIHFGKIFHFSRLRLSVTPLREDFPGSSSPSIQVELNSFTL